MQIQWPYVIDIIYIKRFTVGTSKYAKHFIIQYAYKCEGRERSYLNWKD